MTEPSAHPHRVVLLSGGTGGAKLARGMVDLVADRLTVVANVADDIDIYGAHVSPDPDLVTYWLAQRVDPRGWGIAGDTFTVMDALRDLGEHVWFNLGDQDLAVCIQRAAWFRDGVTPTEALRRLTERLGIVARVLPPTDDRLRTTVLASGVRTGVQDYLIRRRGVPEIEDVDVDGLADARVTDAVRAAIAEADVIVIGPSNPALSIRPILELPEMRGLLSGASAPVIAVSPLVRGKVLKGPTAAFLDHIGVPRSVDGIAAVYQGDIDGIVSDDEPAGPLAGDVRHRRCDVLLDTPERRRAVAGEILALADELRA